MGNAALYQRDWKLVQRHGGPWHLFNLRLDPGETTPREAAEPERFEAMRSAYEEYEERMGVVPVPEDYDVMKQLLRASRR